jgi:hypothetical protein
VDGFRIVSKTKRLNMATRKQKQDLMSALKFTPREIEISLGGYGGEIVIGRISEAAYDYWQDRDDLDEYVYDWDNEMEVPADAHFCTDGAWHDVDDICHENGCEASDACLLQVTDVETNDVIWENSLDLDSLASKGVDTSNHSHVRPEEDEPDGTCIFLGQSIEKGLFFSGKVRITEPFDPSKLAISWTDCDGWRLISGVEYDGEEVYGYDAYSTNGKGSEFKVYRVERDEEQPAADFECVQCSWRGLADELDYPTVDGDGVCPECGSPVESVDSLSMPVLEGEEMWASQAIDDAAEVERWEGHALTPWWTAQDVPVREGRYQVLLGNWPFPSFAEYTNKRGWVNEDGRINNLTSWRGLTESAE